MPWREEEQARCKKSKTRLFCISPQYQDRFWIAVYTSLAKWVSGIWHHCCCCWRHKNFWFWGIHPGSSFYIPVPKKADRTKVHFTFPPCQDISCWPAGSPPPPSGCELPVRCRSWGWVSGWSPWCPWERAGQHMKDLLSLAASPPAAQEYHSKGTNKSIHFYFLSFKLAQCLPKIQLLTSFVF